MCLLRVSTPVLFICHSFDWQMHAQINWPIIILKPMMASVKWRPSKPGHSVMQLMSVSYSTVFCIAAMAAVLLSFIQIAQLP